MSGLPVGADTSHPPHGHPDNTGPSTQAADRSCTAAHPPVVKPDPTLTSSSTSPLSPTSSSSAQDGGRPARRESASDASATAEFSSLKMKLKSALRQYPDFPSPGVLFEDIMPIFANPALHRMLLDALALQVAASYGDLNKPDVVVGLDARGFLFGPSLALRLGAGFVPVRKQGKLPGECATAKYVKEYGEDYFQMQKDAIKPGQRVVVVDDIIATGGSAAAAGSLVKQTGGTLLGYIFMMELDFLKGRENLDAPVYTLLSSQ